MSLIKWTNGLSKEEEQKFLRQLAGSRPVLRRLNVLAQEYYDLSDREMRKRDSFTLPAWAEKQAFELGYQKALAQIQNLIKE